MLMGGLRRGEVLGLNVESIDPECTQVLVRGKGSKERVVPLCPILRDLLVAYLEKRPDAAGPLFVGRTGNRTTVTSLTRLFRRLLKRAGLEDEGITPHKLRHAFGTTLVREGVDVSTIAELMGHSSIATTSVYLHASPTTMRAAVGKLRFGERDQEQPLPRSPRTATTNQAPIERDYACGVWEEAKRAGGRMRWRTPAEPRGSMGGISEDLTLEIANVGREAGRPGCQSSLGGTR